MSKIEIPNFEKEYKNQLKKNILLVRKEINNKDFIKKITNHAKKFDRTFEEVKEKILNDDMYAEFFVKDPSKQNIYEKLVAKYISSLENVSEFKNLPSTTKLYIVDGIITNKKNKDVKSIDFYFKINKKNIYVSHKYTKDKGGAQDQQNLDIRSFLRNCKKLDTGDNYFIALCDGPYFISKIKELKDEFASKNVYILTTHEIENVINELAKS